MSELLSNETNRTRQIQNISSTEANEIESVKLQEHGEPKPQDEDVKSKDIHALTTATNVPNVWAADLLDGLKLATNIEVKEKIEVVRLQLECERLEVERVKALSDQKFWVRNFGTAITAIISLAAVLVSLSQIWVASIQKDKELAVAQAQKDKEIEIAKTQKEKELETATVQRDRAWRLDIAKFVLDHGGKLLGKDKAQRELMTRVMLATFPPEYSGELIDRLVAVTDSKEVKQELQNIRIKVLPNIRVNRDAEPSRDRARLESPIVSATPTPSPDITPTATPRSSCRCPPPFEGGVDCWAWDDAAICKIIDNKCVARCVNPKFPSSGNF